MKATTHWAQIAFLSIAVCCVGCGEGPKHLSRSDYTQGKAAFEMLELYGRTGEMSYSISGSHLLEPLPLGPLRNALEDYDLALLERSNADRASDAGPMVKLCRDDAAAYFEPDAPETGSCEKARESFKAAHPGK